MQKRLNLPVHECAHALQSTASDTPNDLTGDSSDHVKIDTANELQVAVNVLPSSAASLSSYVSASMSCRTAWGLWFHENNKHPPLRSLRKKDLCSKEYRCLLNVRNVMERLMTVAVNRGLVASEGALELMSRGEIEALFDDVLAAFLADCGPGCTLTHASPIIKVLTWNAVLPPLAKVIFPTKSCREIWRLWFKGDALTRGTPYRRGTFWETHSPARDTSKRVLAALVQTGVDALVVPPLTSEALLEGMQDDALMDLFDKIFPHFVDQFDASVRAYITPTKICHSIVRYMVPTKWTKHAAHNLQHTAPKKRSAISCRRMWHLWFKGDAASGGIPYRHCHTKSNSHLSIESWGEAKLVMNQLVALGTVKDDALEAMATKALMATFDKVFRVFVRRSIGARFRSLARPEKACKTLLTYIRRS
ncbi:Aste57867_21830 [Aphanomyces stellatus]|uniref:Aste57867_21830 protein n=1 Tax=Aphanomyces stellatus TaxID=120398 RepID=A0A485LJT4_9STRA|nr:hypothetical protein As57867_021761 [Aphanomyces stellatus]VFT98499.1 Aste57867_21830 [Aphanomyces stellatus]